MSAPLLGALLAGCATAGAPSRYGAPLPLEGWDSGGGMPPAASAPKTLRDPKAYLWRAGAGAWMPTGVGDGWNRGNSADGVDADGRGGGARIGVRHAYVKGGSASDAAGGYQAPDSREWVPFFGLDLEYLSARAESGGNEGSFGAADLALVTGMAHFPEFGKGHDFLGEFLVGVRRTSLSLEGPDLAAVDAEESFSGAGFLVGLNLEVPLSERFTILGRIDGSIGGSSDSDSHKTLQAFAGMRAGLAAGLSVEAGWRYFQIEETLRDSRTICFLIICGKETYKTQEAKLVASGPWLGLVYDF